MKIPIVSKSKADFVKFLKKNRLVRSNYTCITCPKEIEDVQGLHVFYATDKACDKNYFAIAATAKLMEMLFKNSGGIL